MQAVRAWRWLHRFGYLTTLIVVAEVILASIALVPQLIDAHRRQVWAERATMTYSEPLAAHPETYLGRDVIPVMDSLSHVGDPSRNILRIVVDPSFGEASYAVVLSEGTTKAPPTGFLLVTDRTKAGAPIHTRSFSFTAASYQSLTRTVDALTDGWPGSNRDFCCDGTGVAFERVRGNRITSGSGNCSPHYERLKALILAFVRRYSPGEDLPNAEDWTKMPPQGH